MAAYRESFADGEWQALRGAIGDLVDTICLEKLPPFAFLPGGAVKRGRVCVRTAELARGRSRG